MGKKDNTGNRMENGEMVPVDDATDHETDATPERVLFGDGRVVTAEDLEPSE